MLFGEDKHGFVWVFGITTRVWGLNFFWALIGFLVEAPDAIRGLKTGGLTLLGMILLCWFTRLCDWFFSTVIFKQPRD